MSNERHDTTTDGLDQSAAANERRGSGGDDERNHREHIASTGEPNRDALGNADGAS